MQKERCTWVTANGRVVFQPVESEGLLIVDEKDLHPVMALTEGSDDDAVHLFVDVPKASSFKRDNSRMFSHTLDVWRHNLSDQLDADNDV